MEDPSTRSPSSEDEQAAKLAAAFLALGDSPSGACRLLACLVGAWLRALRGLQLDPEELEKCLISLGNLHSELLFWGRSSQIQTQSQHLPPEQADLAAAIGAQAMGLWPAGRDSAITWIVDFPEPDEAARQLLEDGHARTPLRVGFVMSEASNRG